MATFTGLGPNNSFPGARQPTFPVFASVSGPTLAPPTGSWIPILPLPGLVGAGSYAMQWLLAAPFIVPLLAYVLR